MYGLKPIITKNMTLLRASFLLLLIVAACNDSSDDGSCDSSPEPGSFDLTCDDSYQRLLDDFEIHFCQNPGSYDFVECAGNGNFVVTDDGLTIPFDTSLDLEDEMKCLGFYPLITCSSSYEGFSGTELVIGQIPLSNEMHLSMSMVVPVGKDPGVELQSVIVTYSPFNQECSFYMPYTLPGDATVPFDCGILNVSESNRFRFTPFVNPSSGELEINGQIFAVKNIAEPKDIYGMIGPSFDVANGVAQDPVNGGDTIYIESFSVLNPDGEWRTLRNSGNRN
ncbi:hypothetical protein A2263_02985 [Candidatus Peregrinibacteria bacterium RIFOXYA2_FULL_33_21]|nr:MAG: hypothetical protein A2263_02985 [Candidatus Peregrinibacteria bacterium RIFOXYA2_FULL_33_21]